MIPNLGDSLPLEGKVSPEAVYLLKPHRVLLRERIG
jgi:hypothetical protein